MNICTCQLLQCALCDISKYGKVDNTFQGHYISQKCQLMNNAIDPFLCYCHTEHYSTLKISSIHIY